MTLAFPKRVPIRHREVSVKQIEFDLGRDHDASTPAMPVPPKVAEALVRLMATAIIAVHQATQEADNDDPGCKR
jgi:hypothetical protein